MTDEQFWALIARLDWSKTGDDEAVVEPVVAALATLDERAICAFEDRLAVALHALDTEAHARAIGEDAYAGPDEFFSPDAFLYARCVVVANGRALYERVRAAPAAMPKDLEFEALLWVAPAAYRRRTGRELDHDPPVSYETFSNRAGWPEAADEDADAAADAAPGEAAG